MIAFNEVESTISIAYSCATSVSLPFLGMWCILPSVLCLALLTYLFVHAVLHASLSTHPLTRYSKEMWVSEL